MKRIYSAALIAVVAAMSLGFGQCGPGTNPQPTNPDAYGPASSTPLLPGATMITQAQYEDLLTQNKITTISPDGERRLAEEARTRQEHNRAELDQYVRSLAGNSSVERLLAEPMAFEADFQPTGDGNYQLTLREGLRSRTVINRVVTLGRGALLERYGEVLHRRNTFDNEIGQYREMYEAIPIELRTQFELANPDTLSRSRDFSVVRAATLRIASLSERLIAVLRPGGTPPAARPGTCSGEVEAANNTDRTPSAGACESFSANGVYQNYVWPQKWYATCVKDQANRGTCGSFGITAAMETGIALKFNRWVNLSEQDLYYRVKRTWWPSNYGDGINTHTVWQKMLEQNYLQPFESQWPYNPSRSRIDNDVAMTYTSSCVGYQFPNPPNPIIPNFCSDTVHQGGQFCVNVGPYQFCGFYSPVPSDNTSGYRADNEWEVWDPALKDLSLVITRLSLQAKLPTVLWAFVTPSFDNPNADGFVSYIGAGEGNRGSHIYQITGFIDNATLAARLPGAPAGSGGGYIIAKNSWGPCYGDAGYVYLPYDWVKEYAISVTVLSGVQ